MKRKKVLDLGCGEGYYSRVFAELGAHVTGIDFSEEMVNAASEEEIRLPLGINYVTADASNLKEIESCCFDVVFSFMTLMDIEDYEAAVKEVARVLKERGRFIIVTLHPCFEWSDDRQISGWETRVREDGSKISQYFLYDYFNQRIETVSWDFERL
ncbi:MAG: methyltransferase domain-containing protein, partial [Candidatus Thorarchaeota archaeon]|nr:methyltransferase domain-containing protein [Candidatus Thorarchaeota archaeon]